MQVKGQVPRFACRVHPGIERLGCLDILTGRLDPHRHVALGFAVLQDGCDIGLHPVMVTVLSPVFNHTRPWGTAAGRAPKIFVGCGWHIGMANEVVVLANQFLVGVAADCNKSMIAVGDDAPGVSHRHQHVFSRVVKFLLGDWQVHAHDGFFLGIQDPPTLHPMYLLSQWAMPKKTWQIRSFSDQKSALYWHTRRDAQEDQR